MNTAATFWIGVLLLAVGLYGGYTFYKIATSDPAWAAAAEPDGSSQSDGLVDFTLTSQTGERFHSKSLKNKVWVGSVFFSLCPSECKLQNQAIAQLRKQLAGDDLTWISITCDPTMDTPAVLAEYAKRFDADPRTWKFLTGKEEHIRRVAVDYFKVPFGRQTHSKHLILIGRDGNVAGRYDVFNSKQVVRFKKKVGELLSDKSEPSEPTSAKEAAGDDTGSKSSSLGAKKELDRAAS